MAKNPPEPPTVAPWVAAPTPEPVDDVRAFDSAAVDQGQELEDFLDEVTREASEPTVVPDPAPEPVLPSAPQLTAPQAPLSVAPLHEAEAARQGIEVPPTFYAPADPPAAPSLRPDWLEAAQRQPQSVAYVDEQTHAATPNTDTDWRLDTVQPVAKSGWRRWVYYASGKTLNLGEGPAEIAARNLDRTLQTPIESEIAVAVVQLKGGSAKTTTTMGVGNAFAEARSDAVLAIDVNPDRGNLARRTKSRTVSSVFTLLNSARPGRMQDIRVHTNETPAGLEILASAQDPAAAQAFSAKDYHQAFDIVKDFYSLILSDCGTNITHPATLAALDRADVVIIPLDAKNDNAKEAVAAIEFLQNAFEKDPVTNEAVTDAAGNKRWLYRHLLARTIVVVSHQRPGRRMFDVESSLAWFNERVADVHVIPYDPHLEESDEIVPERLNPATRLAYREVAAKVAAHFPSTYSAGTTLRQAV